MKMRAMLAMVLAVGGLAVAPPLREAAAQTATGSITGFVFTDTAAPVPGAEFYLDDNPEPVAFADAGGAFAIPDVTEGHHSIAVRAAGYAPAVLGLTVFASQDNYVGEIFIYPLTASVSGAIADANGLGVYPATVELVDAGQSVVRQVSTSATGEYVITTVAAGDYELRVNDESGVLAPGTLPVSVAAGVDLVGVNLELSPALASLAGVLRYPDGGGVASTRVTIVASDFSAVFERQTNSSGLFAVAEPLPGGTYRVHVEPFGRYAAVSADVQITEGVVSSVALDLAIAPGIEGIVTKGGAPAVGFEVVLWSAGPDGSPGQWAITDEAGRYSITTTSGDFLVQVSSPEPEVASEFVPDTALRSKAMTFAVVDSRVVVDVDLESASSISGLVTATDNSPVAMHSEAVHAFPLGGDWLPGMNPSCASSTYSADGTYTIGCLHPSEDWLVRAVVNQFDPEYFDNAVTISAANPVAVDPGQVTTGIDFSLSSWPTLSLSRIEPSVFPPDSVTTDVRLFGSGFAGDIGQLSVTDSSPGNASFEVTSIISDTELALTVTAGPGPPDPTTAVSGSLRLARQLGGSALCECSYFIPGPEVAPTGSATFQIQGGLFDFETIPQPGAQVFLDGAAEPVATTDDAGFVTLADLPSGPHTLRIVARGFMERQFSYYFGPVQSDVVVIYLREVLTSISGRAVDTQGTPLTEITVDLTTDFTQTSVRTGPDGRFSFDGLRTGTYGVHLSDRSGRHLRFDAAVQAIGGEPADLGDVALPSITTGIAGVVTDSTGAPIVGANVYLSVVNGSELAITNSLGEFGFATAAGVYEVYVTAYERSDLGTERLTGVVVSDTALTVLDVAMGAPHVLAGVVTGPSGDPMPGAFLRLRPAVGFGGDFTVSADDGSYSFIVRDEALYRLHVEPGDLTAVAEWYPNGISPSDAQVLDIQSGATSVIDIALEPPSSISGAVIVPEGLGNYVEVALVSSTGTENDQFYAYGISDGGTFRVDRVRPGTYKMRIWSEGAGQYYNGKLSFETATPITVGLAEEKIVDLHISPVRPPMRVIGLSQSVFVAGTTTTVRLYGENFPLEPTALRVNGTEDFTGLPDPIFTVRQVLSSTEAVVDVTVAPWPEIDSAWGGRLSVSMPTGEFAVCDCSVRVHTPGLAAGSASGRVIDTHGRGVAHSIVELERDLADGFGGVERLRVVSDASGRWELGSIPAERYRVVFLGTPSLAGEWWSDSRAEGRARSLVVAGGSTARGVNAELNRRGVISLAASNHSTTVGAALALQLGGRGLSPIIGGFAVYAESAEGQRFDLVSDVTSDRSITAAGAVYAEGAFDLVLSWRDGATLQTSRCVGCLTVYGGLSVYYAENDPFGSANVTRNGTTPVNVYGEGFDDVTGITVSGQGVTADWVVSDSGTMVANFTVTGQAALGPRTVTLTAPGGRQATFVVTVV